MTVDGRGPGLDARAADDVRTVPNDAMPSQGTFCALPGSVIWNDQGFATVPGAPAQGPDLTWLKLPTGFCAHYFGTVANARQLRFAPGGDLFVASPTTTTTGGNPSGALAGVAVLPDDDHDGVADTNITFLDSLPSVQGLMFAGGFLYYQDGSTIRRVTFQAGDRHPSAASDAVTTFDPNQVWQDQLHWPKVFDRAQDGTIYISNGSTQSEPCTSARPVFGAIFKLNADGTTSEVAKGFRNPIALRCEADHNVCIAAELALDYSNGKAGREKLVPIRSGDDWGYPCCATQATPYTGVVYNDTGMVPDCSGVAQESGSFVIGHTPFGLDFESGQWPAPWAHRLFLALHGDVSTWNGARIVAIALDANTGLPLPASELDGGAADPNSMLEFATGWADGKVDHGRPAPVAFAPDGRLFLGDDQRGLIVWIAPVDARRP